MRPDVALAYQFVRAIPDELEEHTVYVSIDFATVAHLCLCGCGSEVVTPLTPTDWRLTFDGETISLDPSVGSWQLPCRSHYWIRRNRGHWSRPWSQEQVEAGREADTLAKARYYGGDEPTAGPSPADPPAGPAPGPAADAGGPIAMPAKAGLWHRLGRWLSGR